MRTRMNMKIFGSKWNPSHLVRPNTLQTAMAACFAAFIFLSSFSEAMAEVSLRIDGAGQLTGATGVVVGTTTFDVSFVDGTCMDLFSGCDDAGNFTFKTLEEARLAATALETTVILNSEKGNFDSMPWKVQGCTGTVTACSIVTPFGFSADAPEEISAVSFVNAPKTMDAGPITGASNFVAQEWIKDKKTKPLIGVWAVWSSPAPKP